MSLEMDPNNPEATPNVTNVTPAARRPAYKTTYKRMRVFLESYAETGRVDEASRTAGISKMSHYRKLATDPEYRQAFERMELQVGQMLEDLAVQRVREGVQKQLFYQGEPVMLDGKYAYETTYDSHLHHVLLKRFKREAYKERIEQQISGEITITDRIGAARKRVLEMNRSAGRTEPEDLAG